MSMLLLVDSMGLLYRGHFALATRPLRAPDGLVTSGVSHLVSEVMSFRERFSPSHAAVVFDSPEPGFRSGLYGDYKANRPPAPDDLVAQIVASPPLLESLGFATLQAPGFEADDLIASAAVQAAEAGVQVTILSSDKDLLQLVGPLVSVYRPGVPGRPGNMAGPEEVLDILGVAPEQVVDFLSLAGDSSDNVPGARGIGPRTASSLLGEFGSLDEVYRSLDRVRPDAVRRKLEHSRDAVMLSRDLVTLRIDSIPSIDLESLSIRAVDRSKALPLLERLGMRRVMERLPAAPPAVEGPGGMSGSGPGAGAEGVNTGPMCLEAFGVESEGPEAVCDGLASSDGSVFHMGRPDEREALRRFLGESGGLRSPDAKEMLHLMRGMDMEPVVAGDPSIADYLLSSGNSARSLERLAEDLLGESLPPASGPSEADAVRRASTCSRLLRVLAGSLEADERLGRLYGDLEIPLVPVLCSMEDRGMGLDMEFLGRLSEEFRGDLHALERKAAEIAGVEVNLNSPARVSEILFGKLGLPKVRKTGTGGDSSGMTVLQALSGMHPFVGVVIEHRELAKLLSTYVDRLPDFISRRTGLIHTRFNQTVTATGRLSSSNPNLQNIPIRTERGRRIRRCFLPGRPGHLIISADYSQIELRVLAHFAGEGTLREAYRRGEDIHSRTAEAVFGDSSPEHRRKSKEVNFSIVYGISPHGLSQRLGVGRDEAAAIINRYFAEYPEVDEFFRRCVRDAEASGETRTLLGRRRAFPDLAAARGSLRKGMERMVVNTTIQGSGADIVKLAMLAVARRLTREIPEAGLALQVHDELVVTAPAGSAGQVRTLLEKEMAGAVELAVPLGVESGVGGNWLAAGH